MLLQKQLLEIKKVEYNFTKPKNDFLFLNAESAGNERFFNDAIAKQFFVRQYSLR